MFYQKLDELQIENTSICNAACPMCLREHTPDDKSWFKETYLSTEFFSNNIPQHIWTQIERVLFNGVLGDPCAAPNFLDVCRTIKKLNNSVQITISTNGGLRNEAFWTELASILSPSDIVIFAIDGLEDTNHIYRVNVNFDKVMANSRAFILAGGTAHWQFISFAHNEHQIAEAELKSVALGFKSFFVKPSYRFILDEMTGTQHYGSNGVLLEPPTGNTVHKLIQFKPKKFNIAEWQASSNSSNINCYARHNKSAYIDHLGRLFPCCPLASGMMVRRTITSFKDGWDQLWNMYGGDSIDLHLHTWDDIVNGPFFAGVKDSWTKDYASGRLASCAGTCSDSELKFNHKEV
jgi:MoaA/NifB/PqqE/SkfB family radical SAM enzyme